MFGRKQFEANFNVGEVVKSGGNRANLKIEEIADDWFLIVPLHSVHKERRRLHYGNLGAVIDGFDKINPKSMVRGVNQVLVAAGRNRDFTTENYIYGFAREYLKRNGATPQEQLPEEIPPGVSVKEGARKTITVNAYERNSAARKRCIQHWKENCVVCGFFFEKKYGELGKGYIHVHHLKPLGEIREEYELDPVKDLRPVCPNCHAMLHRQKDVLSIEALQKIIKNTARG